MHWSEKYLGEQWTNEQDCFYWFRLIQKEEFNRDIIDLVQSENKLLFAAHNMTDDKIIKFDWQKTDNPKEGDAVLMSMLNYPTHIGVVALVGNQIHVVHAVENGRVTISRLMVMKIKNWNISGFWTPINEN